MAEGARGCLKYGCIGCGGLAALGLLFIAIVAVLGFVSSTREPDFRDVDRSEPVEAYLEEGIRPEELGGGGPLGAAPSAPGVVRLDVNMSRLRVFPAEPGEPIRVRGRYDDASFELTQELRETEDGSWEFELGLRRRGFALFNIQASEDELANRIDLALPPGVPIVLTGQVGIGETRMELGGLWVVEVDLDAGVGEHEIRFSEPTALPMERLSLEGSIGENRLYGVGNASPRELEVSHNIGELSVDLRGAWQNDAEVDVRCGIGSCRVRVPRGVRPRLVDAGVTMGESNFDVLRRWPETDPGLPELELSLRGRIGEVLIER